MLSVIATAGFADTRNLRIKTANTIIPKGKLISTLRQGFVMAHKGKVYVCYPNDHRVHCKENTEY